MANCGSVNEACACAPSSTVTDFLKQNQPYMWLYKSGNRMYISAYLLSITRNFRTLRLDQSGTIV